MFEFLDLVMSLGKHHLYLIMKKWQLVHLCDYLLLFGTKQKYSILEKCCLALLVQNAKQN